MTAQWDTSYIIGMVITIIITAGALITLIAAFIVGAVTKGERGVGVIVISALVFVIAGIIGTVVAWPFDSQYHRYVPLGGVVTQVSSRLIASDTSGGGSTQKFVLTFRDGTALGCNDTRCSQVDKGDVVELLCERSYQFNAPSPGYDCNWGSDRKPNGSLVP